jgi:hypothetical protein
LQDGSWPSQKQADSTPASAIITERDSRPLLIQFGGQDHWGAELAAGSGSGGDTLF